MALLVAPSFPGAGVPEEKRSRAGAGARPGQAQSMRFVGADFTMARNDLKNIKEVMGRSVCFFW